MLTRWPGRRTRLRVGATAAALAAATALAGCTSSATTSQTPAIPSPSLSGTAICNFLTQLNQTAAQATSADAGLAALTQLEPQLEKAASTAPSAAKTDLQTVISAAKDAVATKDLSKLASDPVAQAGSRLAEQCGLAADGPVPFATTT